jgi:hypothetical protein
MDRESNFGGRTIPRYTETIKNHELYISALLCKFQCLSNAFRGEGDEQIMKAIDDNFDPLGSWCFMDLQDTTPLSTHHILIFPNSE